MPHRSRSLVALGAGAIVGAAIATLVLKHEHPTNSDIHAAPPHYAESVHDHGALPRRETAPDGDTPTFYSEMTDVNARMHDGMAVVPSDDVDRDFIATALRAVGEQGIGAVGISVMGGPQLPMAIAVSKARRPHMRSRKVAVSHVKVTWARLWPAVSRRSVPPSTTKSRASATPSAKANR